MNEKKLKQTRKQMEELYIIYRREYLQQTKSGYITVKPNEEFKYRLNYYPVQQHLLENWTIGVKIGATAGLTKFLAFDIDFKDNLTKAKDVAEELVEHLTGYYPIPLDKVHTHFSGGKGYHVTVFLDKAMQVDSLELFYREVINELGYKDTEVEMRPKRGLGVKLPLGVHQGTGNYMNFMQYIPEAKTLIPLNKKQSINYFNRIEQLDAEYFREYVLKDLDITGKQKQIATVSTKTAQEYEEVDAGVNISGTSEEGIIKKATEVLSKGHLLYEGTRHNMTFELLKFLNMQGHYEEDAVEQVQDIIANTYDNPDTRVLISKSTTRKEALKEVSRLARYVFEKNYSINYSRKDVYISKEELEEVLSMKGRIQQKQLMYILLIHSKRHADSEGVFYMTYQTIADYGGGTDRASVLKQIYQLQDKEKVLIISRNELDTVRTKIEGSPIKKPNEYKVTLDSYDKESDEQLLLASDIELSLEEASTKLLPEKQVKQLVSRRHYENYFKELYAI